jgi:hypothetical protein
MFLDGEYNILEYTTGFEAVQTKAYEVSKYFKPIAVRKPTGRLTISADNHWVFIPETGVVYLEKKGDSLVRILSTEDSLGGNGVFVGNTLYCLGSTYSKLISYQDLTNITELIETADSLGEIHIDYPEPITNSLSGVVTSANYDATNDITKVILDSNASRDWVLFDSNTGIVYDDYEGVVIDGVDERHYSGNLYTSNIMVGSKYSSNIVLSKYIPRDSNDKPMHFKRLTYKLGEIFYQGYDFSVSYGRGTIGYLPYSITTPNAYLNESDFDSSTVDSRKLRFSLRGYDGINIFIESESIHPLLIKGIRYEITYFRGR